MKKINEYLVICLMCKTLPICLLTFPLMKGRMLAAMFSEIFSVCSNVCSVQLPLYEKKLHR